MLKEEIVNPRYPHLITITRKSGDEWLSDTSETTTIIYEGEGRSYTDTTTTGDGSVDSNKRKASIPVRFDEWNGLVPESGDILTVVKGSITEQWEVKDFEPDNNRSVVYGEMNRNLDVEETVEEEPVEEEPSEEEESGTGSEEGGDNTDDNDLGW